MKGRLAHKLRVGLTELAIVLGARILSGTFLLHAGGAKHPGQAELDEHGPLGVIQPSPGDLDIAQLIRLPAIWS
jgi:hypothetical protein